MPRVCTVCSHPDVDDINRSLLSGATYRMIANQFAVTWQAARRHVLDHIPPLLAKAKEAEDAARASDLLAMAMERDQKALALLDRAESAGDLKTAGQMLRISLTSLELLARLRGELNEQQNTTVNVLLAPEWLVTRAEVMRALEPYVEARLAVASALFALEARGESGTGEGSSNGHSD